MKQMPAEKVSGVFARRGALAALIHPFSQLDNELYEVPGDVLAGDTQQGTFCYERQIVNNVHKNNNYLQQPCPIETGCELRV